MEAGREPFDVFFHLIRNSDALDEGLERFFGFVWQSLFAAAQKDFHLNLVAFAEEFLRLSLFELEIVSIGTEADANTLSLYLFLFGFSLLYLLGLLVLELTVIEDTAHRWLSLRRNLNQIQFLLSRQVEGIGYGYFAMIDTVSINKKNPGNTDLLVHAEARNDFNFGPRAAESSTSNRGKLT
jgi:hypothetical protein